MLQKTRNKDQEAECLLVLLNQIQDVSLILKRGYLLEKNPSSEVLILEISTFDTIFNALPTYIRLIFY